MSTTLAEHSSESTALLGRAVRHAKPLSKQGVQERLFAMWFNGLVYNQIWEDPRVDAAALEMGEGSRVLTISSAGCNALNYLIHRPVQVTAVDLNHHHLALTRLKVAAVRALPSHEALVAFFGRADEPSNVDLYDRYIEPVLDETTREYWNRPTTLMARRIEWFGRGFYKQSRLGKLLGVIHQALRALGRDPRQLLEARTQAERADVFDRVFAPLYDHRVVRWIGSSPLSVFSLGIPPSQHKAMEDDAAQSGGLLEEYRKRTRRLLCAWPVEDNYFAMQAMGRRYEAGSVRALPDYLKPEHYEVMKAGTGSIRTILTSTIDAMERAAEGTYNCFVFLDSQDWMPPAVIERQWRAILKSGGSGSRIIFRTAAAGSPIERALPAELMAHFEYHREASAKFYYEDRSAIYGGFHLYTVR